MKTTAKVVGTAMILLGSMILTGCAGGPTGPEAIETRTTAGIRVTGAGSELYTKIDKSWTEVEDCWGVKVNGEKVTVTVQEPELYDKQGQGVIRVNGQLVYGMRIGNGIWVPPDLAALRHEFSHLIGERATGHLVDNGAGRCWV